MIRALDPDQFLYACQLVFARTSARCPYAVTRGERAYDLLSATMADLNWRSEDIRSFLDRFVSLGELALQPEAQDTILACDDSGVSYLSVEAVRQAATFPLVSAKIGFDSHAFLACMRA